MGPWGEQGWAVPAPGQTNKQQHKQQHKQQSPGGDVPAEAPGDAQHGSESARREASSATTTAAAAPAVHSGRHWTRMNLQANAETLRNRICDRTAGAARGGRSPQPWRRGAPLRSDAARGVWFPPARPQKSTRTENAESSTFTTALLSSFVLFAPGDSTVPTEDQMLSSRQTGNLHKIRVV